VKFLVGKGWRKREFKVTDEEGEIHVFPTGLFIKDMLLRYGEVYPNQVWTKLRELRKNFTLTGEPRAFPKRGWGSYQNIKNYFYWLERLGLIERTRKVEVREMKISGEVDRRGPGLRPRGRPVYHQYYRLTPKGVTEKEAWINPVKALYPESQRGARGRWS